MQFIKKILVIVFIIFIYNQVFSENSINPGEIKNSNEPVIDKQQKINLKIDDPTVDNFNIRVGYLICKPDFEIQSSYNGYINSNSSQSYIHGFMLEILKNYENKNLEWINFGFATSYINLSSEKKINPGSSNISPDIFTNVDIAGVMFIPRMRIVHSVDDNRDVYFGFEMGYGLGYFNQKIQLKRIYNSTSNSGSTMIRNAVINENNFLPVIDFGIVYSGYLSENVMLGFFTKGIKIPIYLSETVYPANDESQTINPSVFSFRNDLVIEMGVSFKILF